jgi:hypothetical protein
MNTAGTIEEFKAIVMLANRVAWGFNQGALDTCILTSYALAAALTDLGHVDARPVRVEAASFPDDDKLRAAILGFRGSRRRARDGYWRGHLAVCIGQSWLLDPTLDQSNVRWADTGVGVEPVAASLSPEFWDLDLAPHQRLMWVRFSTVTTRYLLVPQQGFASAPHARPSHWRPLANEITRRLEKVTNPRRSTTTNPDRVYPEPIPVSKHPVEESHMTISHQDDSAVLAEFASTADPLAQHLENLKKVINRLEREAVCSQKVAQAALEEVESRSLELGTWLSKTFELRESLSNAASVASLLTREQMLRKLNELGYPLTASYFKKIAGRTGGYAGPPIAERWGSVSFYRLDEAVAWAKSLFGSTRCALVDSGVS